MRDMAWIKCWITQKGFAENDVREGMLEASVMNIRWSSGRNLTFVSWHKNKKIWYKKVFFRFSIDELWMKAMQEFCWRRSSHLIIFSHGCHLIKALIFWNFPYLTITLYFFPFRMKDDEVLTIWRFHKFLWNANHLKSKLWLLSFVLTGQRTVQTKKLFWRHWT